MLYKEDFAKHAKMVEGLKHDLSAENAQSITVEDAMTIYQNRLADFLATKNPAFDRDKFTKACGDYLESDE
jgi:hypothetical protein